MEANFYATNKIIYGQRMLQTARKYKLVPEEIYSERNRLADDRTLAKVLFYDIVCQTWLPVGISAVDAENCYDCIAHPVALMIFQAIGVPQEAVMYLLLTIQDMIFFLRTGFGDSKDYAGSTGGKKTQGVCQGNGATPAGLTVTSIDMIQAHKKKGHDMHLTCPKTKTSLHLAGTLFVDDISIEHFDMTNVETVQEVHGALQNSIHNLGRILIATGRALMPA
jgi:hypothetical protein